MKKRELKYEVIRVVAMFLVVFLHELTAVVDNTTISYSIFLIFLLLSNSLFFMLSGKFAFNIDYDEKNYIIKYYCKKFLKLVVPIFIYMIIREFYILYLEEGLKIGYISAVFFKELIGSILFSFPFSEYWFLYNLIANLLIVPFIGKFIINANKKETTIFLSLGIFANVFSIFLEYFNVEYNFIYSFAGRSIFFYLGYFVDKFYSDNKSKKGIYILGSLSFILIILLLRNTKAINTLSYSLPYTLFSIAAFTFIRDNIKLTKFKSVILFIGRYSLSVYMLHMIFLDIFNKIIPILNINQYLYIILVVILTIFSSVCCGIVIENTIIKWVRDLLEKIIVRKTTIKLKS